MARKLVFVKDEIRNLVIKECAKVAEAEAKTFLSPEYAANQPFGSLCERFACEQSIASNGCAAGSNPNFSLGRRRPGDGIVL